MDVFSGFSGEPHPWNVRGHIEVFRKQNSDAGFDNRILIHFDKKSINMLESKLTLPAIDLGPRGQNLAWNASP